MTRWFEVLEDATVERPVRRRRRWRGTVVVAGATAVTMCGGMAVAAAANGSFSTNRVGQASDRGMLLPSNQYVKPYGDRTLISNGRLLASTVSPDGKHLAASTWNNFTGFLSVFDVSGRQAAAAGRHRHDHRPGARRRHGGGRRAAVLAPTAAPCGCRRPPTCCKFAVNADGTVAPKPDRHPAGRHRDRCQRRVPAVGLALSPDGRVSTSPSTAQHPRRHRHHHEQRCSADPGRHRAAPGRRRRQPALRVQRGRPARHSPATVTNLTDGTAVVSDPSTGAATNGTVSVVEPGASGAVTSTIQVGLQPTAMTLSGQHVACRELQRRRVLGHRRDQDAR